MRIRAGMTGTARFAAGIAAFAAFASGNAMAATDGHGPAVPESQPAGPSAAAVAGDDVRWLPWLGCWAPTGSEAGSLWSGDSELLCVLPATSGVEIHTVVGDRTVATTRLTADGERVPVTESGCEGWRSAQWSRDGRRVYLRSELDCEGGTRRVSSGIMSMAPGGEWVDVQAVEAAGQTATRALRYRSARAPAHLEVRLEDAVERKALALETARIAASARLEPEDVAELVRHAGAPATAALLIERGDQFRLDAATLRALARAGVPGEVVDIMVALTYPDRFTIDPVAGSAELAAAEPFRGTPGGYAPGRRPGRGFVGVCPGYYDPFGRFGFFGRPVYGYYGAPVYGLYGSPYYGYCPGFAGVFGRGWRVGTGIPVEVRDSGRLIKGRGYTSSRSGDSATPGRPARPTAGSPAPTSSRPAVTPTRGGSSGGSDSGRRPARPRSNDNDG